MTRQEFRYEWRRTFEGRDDYTCWDGKHFIGRVMLVTNGDGPPLWMWFMSIDQPGKPFVVVEGTSTGRDEARHALEKSYDEENRLVAS